MRNVANEQGVLEESRTTALTERAIAWSTTRFLTSEADVLEEHKLWNRCALRMSVYKCIEHNPSFQKKTCPVTPSVPARLD
jgi:hypothetical protein